jgi:hypothetical protein
MGMNTSTGFKWVGIVVLLAWGCLPLRDLDGAASGKGGSAIDAVADGPGQGGAGGADGLDAAAGTGGAVMTGGTGATGGVGGATGGGIGGEDAAATDASPAMDLAVDLGGAGGTPGTIAPDLPTIYDSPVSGVITYSAGAGWDIDGAMWPAFEIHTPTANYWLVKSSAALASITDTSGVQWINFSSGFRSERGVPNLGGCCQPGNPAKMGLPAMSTVIDPAFIPSTTHLRLVSKSDDGSYWLVWDFFQTHFTLTINRAGKAFGFTYRGVPGGAIDPADKLVLSNETKQAASAPFKGDLPGPAEWAYLSHPVASQSLFLIQHADDTLPETYQVVDGDTAMFVFGGGQTLTTPIRFSLGLVNSTDDQIVRNRITFVRNAIP